MRLAPRQRQLDDLLLAFHELWHPQPFREIRPAWCERWPALTARLLALPDAEVEHLNNDSAAAQALLASVQPALAELAPLSAVPPCASQPLGDWGSRWAWEIPGRKRAQIEAFAGAARSTGQPLLDWCGGKGHLGRLLALQWQVGVRSLEIDATLCQAGEQLAARAGVAQEFACADALTAAPAVFAQPHGVALHACGELHRRLIEQGAAAGMARLDIAPCCYHRGVDDYYQPLSAGLQTRLSRDDSRLAVTETVTASPRLARQRDREMAWKLGFDSWRRSLSADAYRSFKPVPAAWLRASFAEFIGLMAGRENLPSPSVAVVDEFERRGWQRQREVMCLSIVRHAFRRSLEIWLVLDLAVYLEGQGYAVELGSFCDRQLTPRNLLISAQRHA